MTCSFVIHGAPRTKGNSPMIVATPGRRPILLPARQYRRWMKSAGEQSLFIRAQLRRDGVRLPLTAAPVNVSAVFYRQRAQGDEDNFKKGLGDFLQRAGFVKNDRQLHWTGETRLDKDAGAPRIEVKLEWNE